MKKIVLLFALFLVFYFSFCSGRIEYTNNISKQEIDTIDYIPLSTNFVTRHGGILWLLVAKAAINGSSGNMMLDTGMSNFINLDSTFFYSNIDTANLVRTNKIYMYDGHWKIFYKGDVEIMIGKHKVQCKQINVVVENFSKKYEGLFDGIIGKEVFANKMTIIDFDKKRIAFTDHVQIEPSYSAIPLITNVLNREGAYFVKINNLRLGNKKQTVYTLFDTGNMITGLFFKSTLGKKIEKKKEESYIEGDIRFKCDSLFLDTAFILNNVPIGYAKDSNSGYYKIEISEEYDNFGLLGMSIIKSFNMVLDCKNNVLYLKPNRYATKNIVRKNR